MHRFEIFDFEKCCDLDIQVRGYSRLSELARTYPSRMISY